MIEKEEPNFDCQSKPALIFRAFVVTDDLNPRIMDARFLDCGPNLFFVTGIGGSGMVGTRDSVETQCIASLPWTLRLYIRHPGIWWS